MPFQSLSDSVTSLTMIPYPRKPLYIKGLIYSILIYLAVDIFLAVLSATSPDFEMELLFSFQSLFIQYDITFQSMQENTTLFISVMVIFVVLIGIFAYLGAKWSNIFGMLIPNPNKRWRSHPYLVKLSQQGIEIHSKKDNQEIKEVLTWQKDIFSVLLKGYFQITLITASVLPQKTSNPKDLMRIVTLNRFFMTNREGKRAAATLRTFFQTYLPDVYNKKPEILKKSS